MSPGILLMAIPLKAMSSFYGRCQRRLLGKSYKYLLPTPSLVSKAKSLRRKVQTVTLFRQPKLRITILYPFYYLIRIIMSGTNVSPSAQRYSSAPSVPDIHPTSLGGTEPPSETPVYFWNLEDGHSTGSKIPPYSQNMPSVRANDAIGVETVVNSTDGRTQVDFKEYREANGKFRGMLKYH